MARTGHAVSLPSIGAQCKPEAVGGPTVAHSSLSAGNNARASKEQMLKQLARERRRRCKLEKEAQHLRSELAEPGSQPVQKLTKKLLSNHVAVSRHTGGSTSEGAEVLHWKRLVKHSERRLDQEETEERGGGKITQGGYVRSEAQHQFKIAARAREAATREAYGSWQLGGGADAL